MFDRIIQFLYEIPDLTIKKKEPLAQHSSFRIGGPAEVFLEANTVNAVISANKILSDFNVCPLVIGNGSNILFPDDGINGFVLKLTCNKVTVSENKLYAEAGASLASIASIAMRNSLTGLEFAHGIPGTLGGAIIMNAGAYGGEISQVLDTSMYISKDGVFNLPLQHHNFGYRTSFYKQNPGLIVLSATFNLQEGNPSEISEKMSELAAKRREKQPLEYPSAGSTFKRPEGHFAGALIEQCGLKGFSVGGAEVSKKHAGFIVNKGGATADDVKKLIEHIQSVVLKETGFSLECEVCIL